VAHACNLSYSGGRDQEDHVSKPTWTNSSRDPILKKPITHKKRAGGVTQGEGHEFKPQHHRKKGKKERKKEERKEGRKERRKEGERKKE
jgi:hypothetical protein